MRIRELGALRVCAVILTAVALTIPIAAMTDTFVERAEAESESMLKVGFMVEIDSLNPNAGLVDPSYVYYGLVYDCAQTIDNDMDITGNLCTNWYVDEDYEPYGSVWVMEYVQNAYWHDGERFDANDVVFNFNLNAKYYTTMWAFQPYTYYMDYAEKIDEFTVRVHYCDRATGEPIPAAYADILGIHMLPEHMLGDMAATDINFNWEGVFEDSDPPVVGTGPFMATESIYEDFIQGDKLTLVTNPNYFWTEEVSFDGIEMHFFTDATAMAYALEMGDLDIAQLPPHEYDVLKNKVLNGEVEDIYAYDGPRSTQYWTEIGICMNNGGPNPSRLDLSIRQALAMATNKEYINDNYYLGYGEPGTTLIPPINEKWHYEPTDDELYKYDLQAARDLLEESGYRVTEDSPEAPSGEKVRICTADSYAVLEGLVSEGTPLIYDMAIRQECPEERDIAHYLQSEWAKVGVEIEYRVMTEAALSAYVYAYMCDTYIWYWSMDVDPMYMLFCQTKMAWNGWNDNKYYNPAYDENFTAQAQEFDADLRKEYVDNCQRINYRDAAFILLSYVGQTYGWRTDTFSGWGDWDADPGRTMDNFWTANPLFFDLEYIGGGEVEEVPWMAIAAGLGVILAAVAAVVFFKKRGGKKDKKEEKTTPLGD